ncbi:tetratricopeptide repeat protein [Streptomyces sp. NPDC059378]|uniref:tetratricopeptide repeat protein n=1 Tax=Streptomyces sp. NPDC059378 TaxID=3346815 RepID=UPI00368B4DE7
MSRLSREKKREEKRSARSADPASPVVAPLDVRVPASGPGLGGASIGGVPVLPAPGEEVQHAVLSHLHRIALATGHPVVAMVQDDRIGYVVPLRVDLDGASHFAGEPARTAPPKDVPAPAPAPEPPAAPAPAPAARAVPAAPVTPAWQPEDAVPVRQEQPTHLLRALPDHAPQADQPDPAQSGPRSHPQSPSRLDDPAPTFRLRVVSEPPPATPYGTAVAPTGEFGPPPAMDGPPAPAPAPGPLPLPGPLTPLPAPAPAALPPAAEPPSPAAEPRGPASASAFGAPLGGAPEPHLDPYAVPDPDPKPTPARGFDAVAEAVLGDEPPTGSAGTDAPALLAEPIARISGAVKAGQIDVAAALAERTVAEASGTLGPEHPEVLRLLELTAYIAYLAGDPLRAFHLSLDLSRVHRRAGDAEAAYGNVQSAAAAWRAVREPVQGLQLGQELLGLWTELTFEDGPAAEDLGPLESARTRMNRLAERAARNPDAR